MSKWTFDSNSALAGRAIFFLLAAVIGVVVSLVTVLLIELISVVQYISYGGRSEELFATIAAQQPWWRLILAPLVGGLIVGIIINYLPSRRYHGISDVMEACAFNSGRMGVRSGIGAAIAAAVSLGVGAPLGREGPAVHIGASVSAWLAEHLGLDRRQTLALLGCGAAAAVTTSFNAPIAGVIFALEVIVGYYTLRVFAPIVIASLAAVVVRTRIYGAEPLFVVDALGEYSAWELPLFAILGVLAGLLIAGFIKLVSVLRHAWELSHLPIWVRPALAGLLIGLIAIKYPMILSIGYEPTLAALEKTLAFNDLLALLILKTFGTAVALSSGFAGGVFSPSVFLGAMLGGVFILGMAGIWESGAQGIYSVAGMAAVSSAMLGAPISTILIVFELTRDYGVILPVMTAAAFASTTAQMGKHTSYFRWQLANRGVNISSGRDVSLLRTRTVEKLVNQVCTRVSPADRLREVESKLGVARKRIAIVLDEDEFFVGSIDLRELVAQSREAPAEKTVVEIAKDDSVSVTTSTNLVSALQVMADNDIDYLPVLSDMDEEKRSFLGVIFKVDLLAEHYTVLRNAREEEFGVN